jgi:hypothetical protein
VRAGQLHVGQTYTASRLPVTSVVCPGRRYRSTSSVSALRDLGAQLPTGGRRPTAKASPTSRSA